MAGIGLALGGGGPVGIAWEVGVMAALVDADFDLDRVTTIVGTSAGSVVGAHLVNGVPLDELVERQQADARLPGVSETGDAADSEATRPDMTRVIEIFSLLGDRGAPTENLTARVGQLALDAPTPPEQSWVGNFERTLAGLDWTDADLRVTAVDCESGARTVWTAADQVALSLAVASSCAVPGMFAPVTIGGRRYTDGGVWSISNADLLADSGVDRAIFIGPIGAVGGKLSPALEREQALLAESGIHLEAIGPGPEFADRVGMNLMDPSYRGVGVELGQADGAAAAERVLART